MLGRLDSLPFRMATTPCGLILPMAEAFHSARPAILASQLTQLRALLAGIVPANRFYTDKLNATRVTPEIASLSDFSARFPFTVKQELVENQKALPPYGTNLTFSLERYTRCHQTSGTTGTPLRWLDTPESWNWMLQNWKEVYRAAGVTGADRIFFAFSFGPFIGFWLAFDAAAQLGCLCLPGGGLSSAARLQMMIDLGATVLCCTPTYAIRLAEVAAADGINLAEGKIATIIVAGEPGGSIPATRARLEQLWPGARVFDHHGMTEVGPVTYECPARPGVLHVIESGFLAEVIDPASDKAVPSGSTGELVLTTLGRMASPLLRYRTGDLVKAPSLSQPSTLNPQPCPCGRHDVALEGGILGRVDDMVVVRGVNIFPSAIEEIMRGCSDVAEYQVQVNQAQALTELTIKVEPVHEGVDANGLMARLEKAFLNAFALRVPVAVVPPGTLPRFELKAKRWIRS
jgi:phenylacetate-CoA ligase